MEGNRSGDRGWSGAVRSGLLTGISTAAVSGSAAVLGVILSRKFGHGVKTDGFFAAYGVYLALVARCQLAARRRPAAVRRAARAADRLGREVATWAAGLALPLALVTLVAVRRPPDRGRGADVERARATRRPRCCPGSFHRPSRRSTAGSWPAHSPRSTTTSGRRSGSLSGRSLGVVLTVLLDRPRHRRLRVGSRSERRRLARVPLVAAARARRARPPGLPARWPRLAELLEGASLPVALQGLYLIAIPIRVWARHRARHDASRTRT